MIYFLSDTGFDQMQIMFLVVEQLPFLHRHEALSATSKYYEEEVRGKHTYHMVAHDTIMESLPSITLIIFIYSSQAWDQS